MSDATGLPADQQNFARRTIMHPPTVAAPRRTCYPRPGRACPRPRDRPARRWWRATGRAWPSAVAGSSSAQGAASMRTKPSRCGRASRGEPCRAAVRPAMPGHGMCLALHPWLVGREPGIGAEPAACKSLRGVARIDEPGLARGAQGRDQGEPWGPRAAAAAAAGPQARAPRPCRRVRWHRCRPRDAMPPSRPGPRGDAPGAGGGSPGAASVQEQRHPGNARRCLDAGGGLGTRPDEDAGRDAPVPPAKPPPVGLARLPAAARDPRSGQGPSRRVARPFGGEERQRHAVGAARDGDG